MPAFNTLDEALLDVETRFLNNLPREELEQVDRLFFQIEQAHWFYEDHIRPNCPNLPKFNKLKTFAANIFGHCDILAPMKHKFEDLYSQFSAYKSLIPTNGCILLNKDCTEFVLCKSYFGGSWGLPRGKVNQGEEPYECALRETLEETGYDATLRSNRNNFLVHVENENKTVRMYIVLAVPEDFPFAPLTRCEVSEVGFFPIDELPKGCFGIIPFIHKLKRWIRSNRAMIVSSTAMFEKQTNSHARSASAGAGGGAARKQLTGAGGKSAAITGIVPRQADKKSTASTATERRSSSVTTGRTPKVAAKKDRERGRGGGATATEKQFDCRNELTFADEFSAGAGDAAKRWSVGDMFAANHKITGVDYDVYDGNPHTFGSYHPRYVNYNQSQSQTAGSSSSSGSSGSGGGPSPAPTGTNTSGMRLLSSLSSGSSQTQPQAHAVTSASPITLVTAPPRPTLRPCPQLPQVEDRSINAHLGKSVFVSTNTEKAIKGAVSFIVGEAFATPFRFQ